MAACIPTGMRHDASDVYLIVPKTVQAAIMAPTYHNVLYMVVNFPRCWGWASSVIRSGADPWVMFDLEKLYECSVRLIDKRNVPKTHEKSPCQKHAGVDSRYHLNNGSYEEDHESNGHAQLSPKSISDIGSCNAKFKSARLLATRGQLEVVPMNNEQTPPIF